MSVQFGRWNFDGISSAPAYVEKVRAILAPYGPDGGSSYSQGGVDILYHAFHTTKESRHEVQPHLLKSGVVIAWDGRLDNRSDFIGLLKDSLSQDSPDVSVVGAAYERWGSDCFARLIGDWALSVWDPNEPSVILATDFIGTHHLYYFLETDRLTWSSVLDPLVLLAERTFALDEEYIAGWLGMFPAARLTPYVNIRSVTPSCFVRLGQRIEAHVKYWDFNPNKRIRYGSDADYEDHFRTVFADSIRRRLRSDAPILAELSGGIDSSSIVCMADALVALGVGQTARLDTISCYDDSEPNWDERPYFTKVEEKRGRTGFHINLSSQQTLKLDFAIGRFCVVPSLGVPSDAAKQFDTHLISQGARVILSGTGGDEVMGGVPTPIPELADLLSRVQFKALAHQLKLWALHKRKPWFHLLFETARGFLPPELVCVPRDIRPVAWLDSEFTRRSRQALSGYPTRLKWFSSLPSFQENLRMLDMLRRQLASSALPAEPPYEKRYPYLDRPLLEFLFSIPREQLVRPGQRRSLMRRALADVVPREILARRRKAFVVRSPMAGISAEWPKVSELTRNLTCTSLGIVDSTRFAQALEDARRGKSVPMVLLMRTLGIELWLKSLQAWNGENVVRRNIVAIPTAGTKRSVRIREPLKNFISAENTPREGR
jgi:asparagine synthase (glutamine-hydrolysing)